LSITVVQTVTQIATKTVTAIAPQEVVIKVETIGPNEPSFYIFENLKRAITDLNLKFEAPGIPLKVKTESEF